MKKSAAVLALVMLGSTQVALAALDPDTNLRSGSEAGAQLKNVMDSIQRAQVAQQIEEDLARNDAKVKNEQVQEEYQGEIVEFSVTKFDYDKSAVLPEEQLNALMAEYLNKAITIKDLYQLVGKINNMYADGGFVTCKAFLPPQKVTSGVVKLLLVEGKTGEVKVNFNKENKSTRTSYIQRRVDLPSGEIMNVNDLNKQLMYFNGTNDVQLRVALKAGEKPGTTDFEITVFEPQRYNHVFFTDNAGNDTTGYYRGGYFLNVKSLTGNRDNLNIGGVYSKGSFAWSASYDTPISKSGTKLSFGYSGNSTEIIKGEFRDMKVHGHSTAYTVALRQPLIVNDTTRSEVGLEYAYQTSNTTMYHTMKWLDDTVKDLNLYYSHTSYGKSHFFYQKHSYAVYGDYTSGMSSNNDDRNMHYYKLNTYYQKWYQHRQAFNLRLDAQKTWEERFPSSRRFYIGGMNSVRGYKESQLGGYSGISCSLEYQVPISKDYKHNVFAFYDYGYISNECFKDNFIHSLGLGFKSNWNKQLYSTLTVGFPLKKELSKEHISSVRLNYMVSGTF